MKFPFLQLRGLVCQPIQSRGGRLQNNVSRFRDFESGIAVTDQVLPIIGYRPTFSPPVSTLGFLHMGQVHWGNVRLSLST